MLDKLMEQLSQYDEKINKKKKELAELEEKKKTTENKIFSTMMNENNLTMTDIVELIQSYTTEIETSETKTEQIKNASA